MKSHASGRQASDAELSSLAATNRHDGGLNAPSLVHAFDVTVSSVEGFMIYNLQFLRGAAALLVVWVHLRVILETLGLRAFGEGGVDLFFVISGFVMVYTTRRRRPTAAEFMKNRVARIAPIYWAVTLAVYVVATVTPSVLQATSSDPLLLLKSLVFVPFRKPNGLIQPTLFVGWTLNYEMFFYALFAVGLLWRRYEVGLFFVGTVLFVLAVAGQVYRPTSVPAEFYTNPRIVEFAFGIAIGALGERIPTVSAGPVRLTVLLAAIGGFLLVVVDPLLWPHVHLCVTSGLPAVVVVVCALILERSAIVVRNPLALLLGDASYSIYLTHPFVTQAFQKLGARWHAEGASAAALTVGAFCVAMAVGIAVHKWVERPLSRAARDFLLARKTRPKSELLEGQSVSSEG